MGVGDINLNFSISDFQWRMRDAQLFFQGTNSKHSSSKALFFIPTQPVTRFNHLFGTSHREDLKWPSSFLPLALKAFLHCQAAVCSVDEENKLWWGCLSLKCWFSCRQNTWPALFPPLLPLLPCFGELVWGHHVRLYKSKPAWEIFIKKSQELLLKACLALFLLNNTIVQACCCSISIFASKCESCEPSLPACLCGPSHSCLTLQRGSTGGQLRL